MICFLTIAPAFRENAMLAYDGEPEPLEKSYPKENGFYFSNWAILILIVVAIISCLFTWNGSKEFTHSKAVALIVFIVVCLYCSIFLEEWERRWRWKRAFLANNADLELSWKAIKQTARWLAKESILAKCATRPEPVAVSIAKALRAKNDPVILCGSLDELTLAGYLHFHPFEHHLETPLPDLGDLAKD